MITDKEKLFKILLVLSGLLGCFYILSPFIPALLLAAVIGFAINPLMQKIRATRWFSRASSIYILVMGLFLAIAIPFLTVVYKTYSLLLSLDLTGEGKKSTLESFDRHKKEMIDFLNHVASQFGLKKAFDIDAIIGESLQQIFSRVLEGSTYLLAQIPDLLFSFAVFLVALFLFMRHSSQIAKTFYSSHLLKLHESHDVVKILQDASYAAVFSSLITGFVQSFIVSASAGFFMDVDVTLIFIVTFLCSFIPVIGAAPIAFLLSILSFTKGEAGAGIAMAVTGIITGTIDNVIRIVLLKMVKEDLHPFVELLAVIGGVIVLGLPGLFLGPVILSASVRLIPKILSSPKGVKQDSKLL